MFKYTKLLIENRKLKSKIVKLNKELDQVRINYRQDLGISYKKFDDISNELAKNVPAYTEILHAVQVLLKEISEKIEGKKDFKVY